MIITIFAGHRRADRRKLGVGRAMLALTTPIVEPGTIRGPDPRVGALRPVAERGSPPLLAPGRRRWVAPSPSPSTPLRATTRTWCSRTSRTTRTQQPGSRARMAKRPPAFTGFAVRNDTPGNAQGVGHCVRGSRPSLWDRRHHRGRRHVLRIGQQHRAADRCT